MKTILVDLRCTKHVASWWAGLVVNFSAGRQDLGGLGSRRPDARPGAPTPIHLHQNAIPNPQPRKPLAAADLDAFFIVRRRTSALPNMQGLWPRVCLLHRA